MKAVERLMINKARQFVRNYHVRELTPQGKIQQIVYEALKPFQRPQLIRGY